MSGRLEITFLRQLPNISGVSFGLTSGNLVSIQLMRVY